MLHDECMWALVDALILRADEGRGSQIKATRQIKTKAGQEECSTLTGRGKRLSRKVLKVLKSDCSQRGESHTEGRVILPIGEMYVL